jgi:hypothetical protein
MQILKLDDGMKLVGIEGECLLLLLLLLLGCGFWCGTLGADDG